MRLLAIVATLWMVAWTALAQTPGPDPLAESLFPPELVMQNQQAIELTAAQKEFLRNELRQAQGRFVELQWQLQEEVEKLAALVRPDQADETRVLAQLDRVLAAEREIKRAQIALVVHIKNQLTREQQARLRELRSKSAAR